MQLNDTKQNEVRKMILIKKPEYAILEKSIKQNGQTFSGLMRVLIKNYLEDSQSP